jgi:2-polyprenyl-3-methyl-5-hydroxy-6-metoxy-1,4-benzoquinol methylase
MIDRTQHWQQVYTTKHENEVSWFQERPDISLAMIKAAGARPESAIVDIGGGASRLVDVLLQDGYRALTVLDLSAAALEAAKQRVGSAGANVDWIEADVTTWRPQRQYDIWHDRAAFHFLTEPADRAAYVERLRQALVPTGQAIIGTFALDGPEKCSGLPVQRYDARSLADTLGSDFRLLVTRSDIHRTPWQSTQSFQFSRFERV